MRERQERQLEKELGGGRGERERMRERERERERGNRERDYGGGGEDGNKGEGKRPRKGERGSKLTRERNHMTEKKEEKKFDSERAMKGKAPDITIRVPNPIYRCPICDSSRGANTKGPGFDSHPGVRVPDCVRRPQGRSSVRPRAGSIFLLPSSQTDRWRCD